MEKNIDEAVKWLRKAAELGSQEAMLKLGNIMYPIDGSFSSLIEKSYHDGYNDAKSGKRNKYIKEEPKIISKSTLDFGNVKVGSIIKFGNYPQNTKDKKEPIEWRVLAVKGGKALIISQYALDCKKYNESYVYTSWEECTLRKWLNSDFLIAAFDPAEQNLIQLSNVTADKNPEYSTDQGNDTKDKVFLLSVKEVEQYFKNDEDRKCNPTKFAINNGAYKDDSGQCWWWLRSLGNYSRSATYVFTGGSVSFGGHGVHDDNDSVRPALWINLKS